MKTQQMRNMIANAIADEEESGRLADLFRQLARGLGAPLHLGSGVPL